MYLLFLFPDFHIFNYHNYGHPTSLAFQLFWVSHYSMYCLFIYLQLYSYKFFYLSTVVEINCCYAFSAKTVLGKGCILTGTLSTANHCSVSYSYFPSFIGQDQNKRKCTNIEELKPKRDGQEQDTQTHAGCLP